MLLRVTRLVAVTVVVALTAVTVLIALTAVTVLIALTAVTVLWRMWRILKSSMTLQIFKRMNRNPILMGRIKRLNKSPIMMGRINKNITEKPSCMMILTDKNPQSMKMKKTLTIATLNTNKKIMTTQLTRI